MTKLIKTPFADSGDKSVIPDTDAAGNVNWTQGFPADYSKNPDTDPSAKRIERDDFNGLLNYITAAIRELQTNGIAPYATAADNGGVAFAYANGATVLYGNKIYKSNKDGNVSTPGDNSDWSLIQLTGTKKIQRWTQAGSFTVPEGVYEIIVTACAGGGGGGGGGGGSDNFFGGGGGGGGAGEFLYRASFAVTPGQVISVAPGGPGIGGVANTSVSSPATAGGQTVIGSLAILRGGGAGVVGGNSSTNAAGGGGGTGYAGGSSGGDGSQYYGTAQGGAGATAPLGSGGGGGRAATDRGVGGSNAAGAGCGGGGGGGKYGGAVGAGGNGGNGSAGLVIIEW